MWPEISEGKDLSDGLLLGSSIFHLKILRNWLYSQDLSRRGLALLLFFAVVANALARQWLIQRVFLDYLPLLHLTISFLFVAWADKNLLILSLYHFSLTLLGNRNLFNLFGLIFSLKNGVNWSIHLTQIKSKVPLINWFLWAQKLI